MALLHRSATMRAVLDDSFDGTSSSPTGGPDRACQRRRRRHARRRGRRTLPGAPSPACSTSSCRPQTRPAGRGPRAGAGVRRRIADPGRTRRQPLARCAAAGTASSVATRPASSRSGPCRDITERSARGGQAEGGAAAGHRRQPHQSRIHRQHGPRAAHAAQRRHRLLRDAEGTDARTDRQGGLCLLRRRTSTPPACACATRSTASWTSRAIEGGRYQLEEDAVPLRDAVARPSAPWAETAERKSITIETRLDGAPPALRADARAIQQILANLLSNAVKFTGDGGRIAPSAPASMPPRRLSPADCRQRRSAFPPTSSTRSWSRSHQADASLARKYGEASASASPWPPA